MPRGIRVAVSCRHHKGRFFRSRLLAIRLHHIIAGLGFAAESIGGSSVLDRLSELPDILGAVVAIGGPDIEKIIHPLVVFWIILAGISAHETE
jgi:hypothetical protein